MKLEIRLDAFGTPMALINAIGDIVDDEGTIVKSFRKTTYRKWGVLPYVVILLSVELDTFDMVNDIRLPSWYPGTLTYKLTDNAKTVNFGFINK